MRADRMAEIRELDQRIRTELEAAAFRTLVEHFARSS